MHFHEQVLPGKPNKQPINDLNPGFMNILNSLQPPDGKPLLNLEGLMKTSIKKEALQLPEAKNLLNGLPDNVVTNLKKIIGKPVKQLLSDNNIMPEVKTIALMVASFQKNIQEKEYAPPVSIKPIAPPPVKANTEKVKQGMASTSIPPIPISQKEPKAAEGLSKVKNETMSHGATPNMTHNVFDFLNLKKEVAPKNSTFINKFKALPDSESQSYGEFKLERDKIPVIQISAKDTPEQSQQSFMKQFESILQSARFNQIAKNQSQMTIQLRPHNLGFMTIKVEQVDHEIIARIITSSTAAKELIEANLHHLKNFSIQVDKFEINMPQQTNSFLREHEQPSQEKNQQNHKKKDDDEQHHQSFEEQLASIMP